MVLLLTVLSGIAWTIVYIDSIRVGFEQKTYAMPIAALGLNIAWEWTYAVRDPTHDPQLQAWVNLKWALADVVILATYFRYGLRARMSAMCCVHVPVKRAVISPSALSLMYPAERISLLFARAIHRRSAGASMKPRYGVGARETFDF